MALVKGKVMVEISWEICYRVALERGVIEKILRLQKMKKKDFRQMSVCLAAGTLYVSNGPFL